MGIILAAKIPALDGTGIALTLGGTLHIDDLAGLELIDSQFATNVQITSFVYAELPKPATTACICLSET